MVQLLNVLYVTLEYSKKVKLTCLRRLSLLCLFNIATFLFLWSLNYWWTALSTSKITPTFYVNSDVVCTVSETKDTQYTAAKPKLILYYKFPDYYGLNSASASDSLNHCSYRCELTINSSRFSEADIVVFFSHSHIMPNLDQEPPQKFPGQIWVFFSVESPPFSFNSGFGSPAWNGLFNWTMTYRHDSDFWHGYLRSVKRVNPADEQTRIKTEKEWREIFSKKTKFVAWFVSHCHTESKREEYVTRLRDFIDVDVYGKCGHLQCTNYTECLEMLRRDYKFYLSFENSLCTDYVTEKLKNIFQVGTIVPIVRGGADYSKLFPPNSVIDTNNFSSHKSLANYLLALAVDEDSYIKMFQWTWDYEITSANLARCELCQRLYENHSESCFYKNVFKWWSHRTCYVPNDI